jgi:WD40 repeat protein
VWDTDGKLLRTFSTHGQVKALAGVRQDHTFVSISADWVIRLWDADLTEIETTTECEPKPSLWCQGEVREVIPFADGRRVLSVTSLTLLPLEREVKIWDLESAQGTGLCGHGYGAAGSDTNVEYAAVSPSDKWVATANGSANVILWDCDYRKELATFVADGAAIVSIAFTHGGRCILAGSRHGTTYLWNIEPQSLRATLPFGSITTAVCPDGINVLCGLADSTLRFWNLDLGIEVWRFSGHSAEITAVAISSDSKRAMSGAADGTMKLWDLESGDELQEFVGHRDPVRALALTSRGVAVSMSSWDGLRMWDLDRADYFCSFMPDEALLCGALGSDEQTIIFGDRVGRIQLLKITDGDLIRNRAYEIYLERGMTNGAPLDDWLKAEREIKARQSATPS